MTITEARETLADLDQQWRAANYERGAAWERLRHSPYNTELVNDFQAKSERCAVVAERIIRYKKEFRI